MSKKFGSNIHSQLFGAESGQKADIMTYSSGHLGPQRLIQSPKETPNRTETLPSLPAQPRSFSQKESHSSSDLEGILHFGLSFTEQESLSNRDQQKTNQPHDREVIAEQDHWAVPEMLERKLQKELKKLSAQSWPSRDRLVVFSDVFEDVCEGSPVFGRILREIKTDYDLYVNHLMDAQPSHNTSQNSSFKDICNAEIRELELEDAEKEVCMLEQEARRALEENRRAQNYLQDVPTIRGPEDSDMKYADGVHSKRLQVMNTWRDIQQLEEEVEELVSTATIRATEWHLKDLQTEIVRLIASKDCLQTTKKELENNINMVLNREKAQKALRRIFWEETLRHCDLQTD